jgi:hypothetical protein
MNSPLTLIALLVRARAPLAIAGFVAAVCALGAAGLAAQQAPAGASSQDRRVGLKPGLHDAGQAAWNLELVKSLPRPAGFFDPKAPAGEPLPPETDAPTTPPAPASSTAAASATGATPAASDPSAPAAANTPVTAPAPATPAAPSGTPATPAPPATSVTSSTPATAAATAVAASAGTASAAAAAPAAATQKPATPPWGGLNFANSDLAFSGHHLFIGNFNGFQTYNIEDPTQVRLLASVICPGGQGDVSVYGQLLFMSVEQTRGRLDCGTGGVTAPVSKERFRGVRIFDISDVRKPKQVAAVQTCRGSHTHTLVTNPKDPANVYIYGSGTSTVRSGDELSGCSDREPKDDPASSLFSIDVIHVPVAQPAKARIVSRPRIFADMASGAIAGLWQGGDHGPGTQKTSVTNQCHDITVFPELGLAAGACSGNGILLDISRPEQPVRLDHASDKNFAYWHSATFNNDGSKVIFTDEWGGGTRPRCRATDLPNWGADAIFEIVDRKLQFAGYYKMPAPQADVENCVAHNGSLVPVPGRDIMVQAWYQGGLSMFDFTDPAHPVEIAYFDRGPLDAEKLIVGGYWSTYWHNGHIYATEMARGLDVFALKPSEFLSQNEIDAATLVQTQEFNPQQQKRVTWPAQSVVALAYVDQLTRSRAISEERASAVRTALARADQVRSSRDRDAAGVATEIGTLAAAVAGDASAAAGRDAVRLRALGEVLTARVALLR